MTMALPQSRNWGTEAPLPNTVEQIDMQSVVNGYCAVYDTIEALNNLADDQTVWIAELAETLKSFESRCLKYMKTYATRTSHGRWILATGLPIWAAAGFQCGINPGATIKGPSTLWMFCGMEHRRYTSVEQVKEILREVVGHNPQGFIDDKQLREIGDRIDRYPGPMLGTHPTYDEVFKWATKRRYSEFLRPLALRLGDFIQNDKQNLYHEVYIRALEKEAEQGLEKSASPGLLKLEGYARTTAVRQFLNDYYERLPHVLQGSTTNR